MAPKRQIAAAIFFLFCGSEIEALPWKPAMQTIVQDGLRHRRAPQPTPKPLFAKRQQNFPNSVCGFIGGNVESPALCSTDSSCVWDTDHQIVGCIPLTSGITAVYTGCQDASTTDTGLGNGQLTNAIFACSGNDVCYRNTYDALNGQAYYQYGCGQATFATTVVTSPDGVTGQVARVVETGINLDDVGTGNSGGDDDGDSTTQPSTSVVVTTLTSTSGAPPPSTTSSSQAPNPGTTRTIGTTSIVTSISTAIVTYIPSTTSRPSSTSRTSGSSSTTATTPATSVPDTGNGGGGGGSNSTGAIVGGVVGGVAGIAIIGAGLFFLWRRQKHRKAMRKLSQTSGGSPLPPYDAYSAHAAAQKEKATELPNEPIKHELEGNSGFLQKGPVELPGSTVEEAGTAGTSKGVVPVTEPSTTAPAAPTQPATTTTQPNTTTTATQPTTTTTQPATTTTQPATTNE